MKSGHQSIARPCGIQARLFCNTTRMNYLAHLFLSSDSTDLIVGSLLGDFVKGAIADRYSGDVRSGIELHRRVDAFTDSHSMVRMSKNRIHPERRRFAGIAVDIFYDHFLAKNWPLYSQISLEDFSRRVYRALEEKRDILPDRLKHSLTAMIENDWLIAYRELGAIEAILLRTSRRLRRENPVAHMMVDLLANYDDLEAEFKSFFPDLIEFVEDYKNHRERNRYEVA
jgi:acyl carrier protein phosphodiesterase